MSTLTSIHYHLPINLDKFGFVTREKDPLGSKVKNRCGRDFMYYVMHYFCPKKFSPTRFSPVRIERRGIFGLKVPAPLIWTGLSFKNIPALMRSHGLDLEINSIHVTSYWRFMQATLFTRPRPYRAVLNSIMTSIDAGHAVGIDISYALGGLVDHVMFVYGYDGRNLYVFDTHQLSGLAYEKLTPPEDQRFIMRLPLSEVRDRWTRWNRLWAIRKQHSINMKS